MKVGLSLAAAGIAVLLLAGAALAQQQKASKDAAAAELAVKAVEENDPASLSFGDWEYVLSWRDASPANRAAAEKVWQAIEQKQKGARLKIPAKLVAVTRDGILAAVSEENQQANKADLRAVLAKKPSHLPLSGSSIAIIGRLDGYTPSPFQFHMKDAELAEK